MAYYLFRPGGELKHGEDQIEGLKRLLTEVWPSYGLWLLILLQSFLQYCCQVL